MPPYTHQNDFADFMSIPGPLAAVMHALHFGWAFDGGAMRWRCCVVKAMEVQGDLNSNSKNNKLPSVW